MKVFLTPFFSINRACKNCARALQREDPENWFWHYELEDLPPLGRLERRRGFIPDFSVLLMFDQFLISERAYRRLLQANDPWLGDWPEVVRMLDAEGVLEPVDIERGRRETAAQRGAMLRKDSVDLAKFASANFIHDGLIADAGRALGSTVGGVADLSWHIQPEISTPLTGSDGHTHYVSSALLASSDDPVHYAMKAEAEEIVRSQLREVNAAIALSRWAGADPMAWAPYGGYLATKAAGAGRLDAQGDGEAARLFFEVAFPAFRPDTVTSFSRLRADRRLHSLRNEISRARDTGDLLEPGYPQAMLNEALQFERRAARRRSIFGWIASAIGVIPIPGVGLAASAGAEFVSRGLENHAKRDLEWLYLVSDGSGAS